ncbi:putative Pentatricopeptide repeat-containing protein [Cocos nucifera]|uniref:Putative Pentatricopeptide repeat-containing protein n=1 Tax=Cocos nucifera TaxID=13894 RepID=A0A8K0N9I8_COCNU|nr:putative Pentatricopeptide repeat-containing protein [Cocos nucifera]
MDMHARCGSVDDSYALFKRMDVKSIASWNAMVLGLAPHRNGRKAPDLFKNMSSKGMQPDKITFIGVLSTRSHSGLVSEAYGYVDSMHWSNIIHDMEHHSRMIDVLGSQI